ncbi:hypothetical protein ACLOJK_016439 [Asimina triloba]
MWSCGDDAKHREKATPAARHDKPTRGEETRDEHLALFHRNKLLSVREGVCSREACTITSSKGEMPDEPGSRALQMSISSADINSWKPGTVRVLRSSARLPPPVGVVFNFTCSPLALCSCDCVLHSAGNRGV